MGIQRFSHVMHIVSDVRGQLAPEKSAYDAIRVLSSRHLVRSSKIQAMKSLASLSPLEESSTAVPLAG